MPSTLLWRHIQHEIPVIGDPTLTFTLFQDIQTVELLNPSVNVLRSSVWEVGHQCQTAVQSHALLVSQPLLGAIPAAMKAELDFMRMHAVVDACSHIDARTPRTRPWRAFINGKPLPKGFETRTLRKTSTAKLSVEAL